VPQSFAFLNNEDPVHWTLPIVLAVIGIVLFRRRLPEFGRALGRRIVEFKRGFHGLDDDIAGP
jgi:Sec-independent protein translocase protein TatA